MNERKRFTANQVEDIARENGLGGVFFEDRTAQNTGGRITCGYVYVDDSKQLFCKRGTYDTRFIVCNDFEKLV